MTQHRHIYAVCYIIHNLRSVSLSLSLFLSPSKMQKWINVEFFTSSVVFFSFLLYNININFSVENVCKQKAFTLPPSLNVNCVKMFPSLWKCDLFTDRSSGSNIYLQENRLHFPCNENILTHTNVLKWLTHIFHATIYFGFSIQSQI